MKRIFWDLDGTLVPGLAHRKPTTSNLTEYTQVLREIKSPSELRRLPSTFQNIVRVIASPFEKIVHSNRLRPFSKIGINVIKELSEDKNCEQHILTGRPAGSLKVTTDRLIEKNAEIVEIIPAQRRHLRQPGFDSSGLWKFYQLWSFAKEGDKCILIDNEAKVAATVAIGAQLWKLPIHVILFGEELPELRELGVEFVQDLAEAVKIIRQI